MQIGRLAGEEKMIWLGIAYLIGVAWLVEEAANAPLVP
jgi:hypothetical protein